MSSMEPNKTVRVTIAPHAIITVLLTLLGLWVLYQIRNVAILFLIVVALVVAFSPIIRVWEKYMPRAVAIIVLYFLLFFGFVLIGALIIPTVLHQLSEFLVYVQFLLNQSGYSSDELINRLRDNVNLIVDGKGWEAVSALLSQFRGSLGAVYNTTLGFIGGVIAVLTVFISSFYLLMEEHNFQTFVRNLAPHSKHKLVDRILHKISDKMGNWLRGQLVLMITVAAVISLALAILGVPYPLLLGLWAGLTELFPFVGPLLGAVPGVFLAFTTLGLVKGLIAIAIYLLTQQLENQILVPKIMGKALGLSPVTIIFSLLIGGQLLGFIGLIIAVPAAAVLSVVYEEWRKEN